MSHKPNRRLTTDEQRQVRTLRDGDPSRFTIKKLAEKFGVSRHQIDQLVCDKPRPTRRRDVNKPEGKRGAALAPRFGADPRDKTGQFFNDPLPHNQAATERRKQEKP